MAHSIQSSLPVAIIGAGPIGLAAAAHFIAKGFVPLVLEAGNSVASHLKSYQHVQLFSPWRYNLDQTAMALLEAQGWVKPDLEALPTAGQVIQDYLLPLSELDSLKHHIHWNHRVLHISRDLMDKVKTPGRENSPFVIQVQTPAGPKEFLAQAVIDASGTWAQPNPMGARGLPAIGEAENQAHIHYGMPDLLGEHRSKYLGKKVVVVGAGHSAAGNLIALTQLAQENPQTRIVWAVRGDNVQRVLGGGANDGLAARGQIGITLKALQDSGQLQLITEFKIQEVRESLGQLILVGKNNQGEEKSIEGVDEIIASTGSRPNLEMTRELRLSLDSWLESTAQLAPLIDPNLHSCGSVRPHGYQELSHPESGFFTVGAKSYGRAPNFLMATGYEQVRSIVAYLSGDLENAQKVQLELPQTGVCNARTGNPNAQKNQTSPCCEPTPPSKVLDSCCGTPPQNETAACSGSPSTAQEKVHCNSSLQSLSDKALSCCTPQRTPSHCCA
jgi:thioredoxin reductase